MLGDSGLLLPMAVLISLLLVLSRGTGKLALWWTLLWGGAAGLVLLTKLAFFAWGVGNPRFDFTGLSGHATLAALIWPAALWSLTAGRSAFSVAVSVSVGCVLGAAIALSRWLLNAHSVSEAATGFALGALLAGGFFHLARRQKSVEMRYAGTARVVLLLLVLVQHGRPTPTQVWIRSASARLTGHAPFRRLDLHRNTGTDYLGRVAIPPHWRQDGTATRQ